MATATPTPSTDSSTGILSNLLSPTAIAGIAVSAVITITILALLCWCCCCRHSSRRSRDRDHEFSVSRAESSTPTSELGPVQEPVSILEVDATGRGFTVEEPPPAYYTLEHRTPRPMPVEVGTETRRGQGPEIEAGMEAWNGFQVVSGMSAGMNPRTGTREAPPAEPAAGRNMSLGVDTDVNPVVHAKGESVEEDEEGGLSRSITYLSYSVREAAVGTVAMPSVVTREGAQTQGKS
jgi:hypothetical protein